MIELIEHNWEHITIEEAQELQTVYRYKHSGQNIYTALGTDIRLKCISEVDCGGFPDETWYKANRSRIMQSEIKKKKKLVYSTWTGGNI